MTGKLDPESVWMVTFTGRRFFPLAATVDSVDLRDIAHSLSVLPRYLGHTKVPLFVAHHSVLVAEWVKKLGGSLNDQRWGLMHDASEGYMNDIIRPLKVSGLFDAYLMYEHRLMNVIATKFGLVGEEPELVREVDARICVNEKEGLLRGWAEHKKHGNSRPGIEALPGLKVRPLGPKRSKEAFLAKHKELFVDQV